MSKPGFLFFLAIAVVTARAETLFPTTDGLSWQYQSREEFGGPAAAAPNEGTMIVRLSRATQEGKEFLKVETLDDDLLIKTELITADEHGTLCHFRAGKDGRLAKLDPPQVLVPAALKAGDAWDSDGEVAGMEIHQHFTVVGEEPVRVPAGMFRAFHIHCDDASVMSVALDRWFVPEVGFVKEITVLRGPTGGLLQRTVLELQERPKIIAKPEPTPSPSIAARPVETPSPPIRGPEVEMGPSHGKKLLVEVSTDPGGGSKNEFKSDVENIYVRWHGRGLPEGARVRVSWIAEDVGGLVEPNFVVDETETVAPAPDSSARFTLGRPPDGWAEGKYRVEFYVNDELEETVRVTIVK